jgi:hypothetical protein
MSYLEEARARAKRRKSRWNLLLIPAGFLPVVFVWATAVLLAEQAHMHFYPGESFRSGGGPWVVVAAVAPLFAAIPIGLLVGNFFVRQVAPARAALDHEASSDPTLSYGGSQAALRKAAALAAVASLVATTLGVLLPW